MMNIDQTQDGDNITLKITGRIDTLTSPDLELALLPAVRGAKAVKLDLAEVHYISSAGLRVLVQGETIARKGNVIMTLAHVTDEVWDVFVMTRLNDILNIEK